MAKIAAFAFQILGLAFLYWFAQPVKDVLPVPVILVFQWYIYSEFVQSQNGCSPLSRALRPNNAFKPKPLRSTKHMAEKACHVFGSATQFGLT